jgi:hypothetical protein
MAMATWRALIEHEMSERGESFSAVVAMAPADLDLDRDFDNGFGAVLKANRSRCGRKTESIFRSYTTVRSGLGPFRASRRTRLCRMWVVSKSR